MGEEGYSLSGRVFHTIRENILSGKYKCDEELKEKIIGNHWKPWVMNLVSAVRR